MFRFFENLVDPYEDYPEQDTPPTGLWPFFREYSKPFKKVFILTGVMSLVVAFVEIGLIYYMGRLVDLLGGSPADVWQTYGTEFILVALFILILRPAFQALDVLLLNNAIMPNYGTLFRWRAHRQVLRQSVGWFEDDFAGRIANRIMQTPPAAGEVVFQVFDAISYSLAYLIGAAILLSTSDWRLLVPLLVWFGLYSLLMKWMIKRVGVASKASSDARSEVTGRVVDSYTNIHSVKMFAHHDSEIEYARTAIEKARSTFQKEMRIFTTMDVALVVLNGFLIVGVVGWAFFLWTSGHATVGAVTAAAALTLRLNSMTAWVMWALSTFFQQLGVVAEGMETIAQPITLIDDANAKPLKLTEGQIEMQGLTHHYGRAAGGLEQVNVTVRPGEKIGLIGRSGAGKSSLVKLLLRFYDPEGGRILIDGQDITKLRQDSLRQHIGMVQQDSALLHRSIRENILYGRPDATEPEVIAAAKQAQAHGFITDLADPDGRSGYDAQVGERGVKLSGGQRQRIALARLSTIAEMDRILVMDHGQIVEEGTHEMLLEKGGLYASFWARQSGGFLKTEDDAP